MPIIFFSQCRMWISPKVAIGEWWNGTRALPLLIKDKDKIDAERTSELHSSSSGSYVILARSSNTGPEILTGFYPLIKYRNRIWIRDSVTRSFEINAGVMRGRYFVCSDANISLFATRSGLTASLRENVSLLWRKKRDRYEENVTSMVERQLMVRRGTFTSSSFLPMERLKSYSYELRVCDV